MRSLRALWVLLLVSSLWGCPSITVDDDSNDAADGGVRGGDGDGDGDGDGNGDGDGDGNPDAGAGGGDGVASLVKERAGTASSGEKPTEAPSRTDASMAGSGQVAQSTLQDGDDGDSVWDLEEDVDGDGVADAVQVVFDDETGTLYVAYELEDEGCALAVLVIFYGDGAGGEGDGSGTYLVDAACDDGTAVVAGCEFDSSGTETACGDCVASGNEWTCSESGDVCSCDVDYECSADCACDVECDPDLCLCDVDYECTADCACDVECDDSIPGLCACDVDYECSADCPCDVECGDDVPSTCECDTDFSCTDGCTCDPECASDCACDIDFSCSEGCECDVECP